MKKLVFLLVFLVAGFGSMLAQNMAFDTQTSWEFDNQSTTGSYTKGAVNVSNSNVTAVNGVNVTGGTISFQTGPVSSLLASGTGGSFSGGGGWFTYYLVQNVGSATATNLAGTLVVISSSTSGSGSVRKYQLTMTFSGTDTLGRVFSGTSTQLLTVKVSKTGQISSVQDNGGNTTIMFN